MILTNNILEVLPQTPAAGGDHCLRTLLRPSPCCRILTPEYFQALPLLLVHADIRQSVHWLLVDRYSQRASPFLTVLNVKSVPSNLAKGRIAFLSHIPRCGECICLLR